MNVFFLIFCFFILLGMYRLVKGPTIYDRLMGMNIIHGIIIIIICYLGVRSGKGFYLDIAILLALLSFGEIIAFNKMYGEKR